MAYKSRKHIQTPSQLLSTDALGKLLNQAEPPFLHWQNGGEKHLFCPAAVRSRGHASKALTTLDMGIPGAEDKA